MYEIYIPVFPNGVPIAPPGGGRGAISRRGAFGGQFVNICMYIYIVSLSPNYTCIDML